MLKRILIIFLLALMLSTMMASPAYAIADPDAAPSVDAVYVYNNLLETGDAGVLIEYFLDYSITGNPTETATEAYMGVFIDIDGTTQLKSVAPYTYQDDGYGRGLIWIYFSAAEVTTHGISVANIALYEVWVTGNPTLTWVPGPDPPKTIAGIDYWQPAGTSTPTLFALRVLSYAQLLGTAWTLNLIAETPLGNRLTALGEAYFTNTIPSLRIIAPSVFPSTTISPTIEDLDYTTEFGAVMTNGTGSVVGSPITLASGANTVTTNGAVPGTFTFDLLPGTSGTMADDTGTVTGSPVDLVAGTNIVTVTVNGDFTVTVALENTQTLLEDTILGTGLDLTDIAAIFSMSRLMFSGLVWLLVTVIICAGAYKASDRGLGFGGGGGKVALLVFDVCIIGGALLGLMHPIVAILMFIGFGGFTGFVLFFRHANI